MTLDAASLLAADAAELGAIDADELPPAQLPLYLARVEDLFEPEALARVWRKRGCRAGEEELHARACRALARRGRPDLAEELWRARPEGLQGEGPPVGRLRGGAVAAAAPVRPQEAMDEGLRARVVEAERRLQDERRGRARDGAVTDELRRELRLVRGENRRLADELMALQDAAAKGEEAGELRDALRRAKAEVARLHRELAAVPAPAAPAPAAPGPLPAPPAEDEEEETAAVAVQPLRLPSFADDFLVRTGGVPRHVRARALAIAGALAAGSAAAFRGARPLREGEGLWRVRVGLRYRMLFELDGDVVRFLDLIPRGGLDRWLRDRR